ncbi:betaine--homocysteine S-methyltransferase [Amylibacter sp. IMCC11727]|uniref:betaine--homocysteine S-methyltransferase n=1 Tax=Amylibacter sp. IMCC11727 TaxID=3039851 RepID=UPI00244E32E7|nr:betaine--homocysteine S-methyltransferase [Amylibacter sp. IMCC11727]WGI20722.1 betaine--homocysteine S-methyltransferase [Amylibacter sp. IMCC11727]
MSEKLQKILDTQGWVLADGATGTNLFNMGLEAGEAPEMWNDWHPDRITALYKGAVDAGSDLFLTNSFGGNASRLKLHGAEKRARELSRISAEIAREVADTAGRDVVVAGSMGPTGDIMEPVGTLSHADAVEMFEEQAHGLMEGGADVLWVETISAPEEFAAAAEAIGNVGAPWCGTMSFDTAGRTMMGVTSSGMVDVVAGLAHQPVAFGANCGVGASDLLRTVSGMMDAKPNLPIIAKGNAGIPKYVDGHIHYDGTPDLMAQYAVLARDCGAKIIGGCCGTMPEHLAAMRHSLETQPVGQQPDLSVISAALGEFSSADDGTGETTAPTRTRRRRRA